MQPRRPTRRTIPAILAALSRQSAMSANADPEVLPLRPNGWVPNNRLPVLLYRGILPARAADPAAQLEHMLRRNGWPPHWRNGIYPFHHFHSTAHEILGVASGEGRVMLGGENAAVVTLRAGDVAVLPAGTGHCALELSRDFLVIGAYPPGQDWDLCRAAIPPPALEAMKKLPFPASDPVLGAQGPLRRL
jgi:uncharacterized protein YjlB